ncbi:MAG TPA: TatD family hydrolase [Anaerolineales bacterium]|nr:TatD family hydrolase [Anaerolineales bacterium]
MLIDTHCHLDFEAFDADRDAVLARAAEAGVSVMLNPSIDLQNSAKVVQLAEQHASVFAAVGVHPNDSASWVSESAAKLKGLAQRSRVVAIGEIGLDYYWDKAPKVLQQQVLQHQLSLAAELELPVIVHNRDAGSDVLKLLLDWQAELLRAASPLAERPGVLHSFSGDRAMAGSAIAAHFFIGLSGPLTFKNARDLQAMAAQLPLESLLVETDSPFLSPHPQRQRNEPAKVRLVAEKLAELKGVQFNEIAAATTANAERLFRFGERQ